MERSPEAIAIVCGEASLTYGQLNRRANQLASRLLEQGVRPDVLVGLCAERSPEIAVGILAILKAGGAYVPLDPTYPAERLEFIQRDARVPVLLIQERFAGKLSTTRSRVLYLDSEENFVGGEENPRAVSWPDCLAYAIYTSGSTGQPKGVLVAHRNVTRLFAATDPWFGFGPSDVWTLFHSYAFDFSVWEMWGALLYGGRLAIVPQRVSRSPEELHRLLARERVTVLNQTPSMFRHLSRVDEVGTADLSLRLVIFGGEALDVADLAGWFAGHGDRRPELVNMYGITETTIHVTYRMLRESDAASPRGGGASPIGLPIPDLAVHLLDQNLRPVPPGEPGELFVGGAGISRGYLERPALTAERFVPDPFGARPGTRLYRSGDLAMALPDGGLEYLGRVDRQVKIRGFRIEPEEIEAALLKNPRVKEAAVIARQDSPGEPRLVAYVVLVGERAAVTSDLRDHLRHLLPEHMLPASFVVMGELPLTAHGKIDRRALPAPDAARPQLDVAFAAPSHPVEEEIAGICSKLLGLERLGVHDNLFDLGGHSLLLTRLTARLRDSLGIEVPLQAVFDGPTVAHLARFIRAAIPGAPGSAARLRPVSREGRLPLSFAQERVWFLQRLNRANRAYHSQSLLGFKGLLRVAALEWSLREIVRRHEIFRTTFPEVDGEPVQVIHPPWPVSLTSLDLSALPAAAATAETRHLIALELARPFDLAVLPLVRWTLFRRRADENVLLHVEHHLVHDGWSFNVFLGELSRLYRARCLGEPSPLPEPALQFADFACWQRNWMQGPIAQGHLDYWHRKLEGANGSSLELPFDRPRPAVQSFVGTSLRLRLPPAASRAARSFSRSMGMTLFMTMTAAFFTLLHRSTGSEDVSVGSGMANRAWRESEGLIGMIINTLVLRTDLSGIPTFRDLLSRVRTVVLEAHAHQDFPFEKVVAALRPQRDLSLTPLFQVAFSFHDSPRTDCEYPELELEVQEAISNGSAKFDLNVIVVPRSEQWAGGVPRGDDGAIEILWEYSTDLFDGATIARMAGHFERQLAAGIGSPDRSIAELPLLSAAEHHQVLTEWNDTVSSYARDGSIPARFETRVARQPDAVALVSGDRILSYRELDRRANQMAHHLRALSVGPEVPVGLCLERSLEMVISLLGILKAGGAYLPLDPGYPRERLELMLRDSGAFVVVSERRLASILPDGRDLVCLDRDWPLIAARPEAALRPAIGGQHLAYVVYTSGSTGRPKGVAVPHRGVLRLIEGADYARLTKDEVFLLMAPLSFDASTFELWGCLLNGGRLAVLPGPLTSLAALSEALAGYGVTTLWLTAGLFHQVVEEHLEELGRLDQLLAGGDVLSPGHVRTVLATHHRLALVNGYGPTESTTFACCYRMTAPEWSSAAIPIGRPISNTRVHLLDSSFEPVPIGVGGALYVGGDGLARGYLGSPALTAERFLPDPFGVEPGGRLYRTGDRARLLMDGRIAFLGRDDEQVKVRGFRVELGEIERALVAHPEVRDAVLLAREDGRGDKQLVAYVVAADGAELTMRGLREHLRTTLPQHLIPGTFVMLDTLPLTPNGKVDRAALPTPSRGGAEVRPTFVAPRTAIEERLAGFWREILGIQRVGVHDDFFELGGQSLVALRLVSRMRDGLEAELQVRDIFEHPTVAELCAVLGERAQAQPAGAEPSPSTLGPRGELRRRQAAPPVSFPLSFAQQRLWIVEQIEPGLATHHVFRAFHLRGPLELPTLAAGIGDVVARHEALRTSFRTIAGSVRQVVDVAAPVDLPLIDVSRLCARERESALHDLAAAACALPFELERSPLLRVRLVRLGWQEHVLLLTFHHLVFDGWSFSLFFAELAATYRARLRGEAPSLPPLTAQYRDFTAWQQRRLRGKLLDDLLAYWGERFKGFQGLLELPADRPRPALPSFRGGRRRRALSHGLVAALESLSRAHAASLFMVLLAAFAVLLERLTGCDDLAVGCPVSARERSEFESSIGFFVGTLALRVDLGGDPGFDALLARVRETSLADYARRELPFERLVEELQPQRSMAYHPLVQVFFALQNAPTSELLLDRLEVRPMEISRSTAKVDLTAEVYPATAGLTTFLDYSADLFDATTIERLADQLETLLRRVVCDPRRRLSDLPLLSDACIHQLVVEWNDRAAEYPRGSSIQAQFEAQAERSPEAVAVAFEGEIWTYRELNRRANQLAHHLRALGVRSETAVGLCMERSFEMVAGLLGILKAGGFYLPLDLGYPEERLALMLADSGATRVITERAVADRLPRDRTLLIVVDRDAPQIRLRPGGNPCDWTDGENLAYIIYTSGSQGVPKGVAVSHRAVSRLVRSSDYLSWEPSDRAAQASNSSFDAATFEIWGPLLSGGGIALVARDVSLSPLELARELERQAVTALFLTTALFNLVAREAPTAFRQLKHLLFGGEAVDPRLVARVLEAGAPRRLLHVYGPTESTTFASWHRVESVPDGAATIPIGRPLANTEVLVFDLHHRPVPIGAAGELCIGGDGLARGYWQRPALTAERFIPHPASGRPGERLYRTGDLVRHRPGGQIEFLGRLDDQVKIRGFRVEPGEIEAVLSRHQAVREAVVVARCTESGDRHLVAYVVPVHGAALATPELRGFLAATLPKHMVPTTFAVLDALPLTVNGKVDRRALPEPRVERADTERRSPGTPVEKALAAIWSELLGVPEIGLDDDFFALGGHSLLAIHVATGVGRQIGVELPVRCLFEATTLAGLSTVVERLRSVGAESAGITPLDRQVRRKAPALRQES